MTHFSFTQVQHENQSYLMRLRELSKERPAEAALTYGLDLEEIQCYADLSDQDILSLAYETEISVAIPRFDCSQLKRLLSKPANIRGIYALAPFQENEPLGCRTPKVINIK